MRELRFIDHTIGEALCLGRYQPLLPALLKAYPVTCFDLPAGLAGRKPEGIVVRVWAQADASQLQKLYRLGCRRIVLAADTEGSWCALAAAARQQVEELVIQAPDLAGLDGRCAEEFAQQLQMVGADAVLLSNNSGTLDPFDTESVLHRLLPMLPCKAEYCSVGLPELATANTLAALRAGVGAVHTSVGASAQACTAAMEEVLMSARFFLGLGQNFRVRRLSEDCTAVLHALRMEVPQVKPVIGSNIFAHESGIHVDGVIKNPKLYEVFCPDEVGLTRRLVIGKHSGKAAVRAKLQESGIQITDREAQELTRRAKQLAEKQKRALQDRQMVALYRQLHS